MTPALELLRAVGEFEEHPFGGASIDLHGTALTEETLAACKASDAVLSETQVERVAEALGSILRDRAICR
jgi:isocitrate/isopropylmalate dehydrogenase